MPKQDNSHSGEGARRRRYTRAPLPRPTLLTPTQVALLRFLAECRFLSLPQLARLACPAARTDLSEKSARRQLRVLFDAGLVDVIPVSRVSLAPPEAANDSSLLFGSAPNIYVPTAAGLRLLAEAGLSQADRLRRAGTAAYGPKNGLFLAHELAVRDVRVWLEDLRRRSEGTQEILRWTDGPDAHIELDARRGGMGSARPDAWFVCELHLPARPVYLVGLVEVDRGTERGDRHWTTKVDAYRTLFAQPATLQAATGYQNARVLVLTPTAPRRDRLAALIAERAASSPDFGGRFWLAEQAVLTEASLSAPVWRRPGQEGLWPLVPTNLMPATPK